MTDAMTSPVLRVINVIIGATDKPTREAIAAALWEAAKQEDAAERTFFQAIAAGFRAAGS